MADAVVVAGFLASGAREWRLSQRAVLALALGPVLVATSGVVAAACGGATYMWFVDEDGPVETAQAITLAAACLTGLGLARARFRRRARWRGALALVLATAFALALGEEISWGQRLFGWATPAGLDALNRQHEANLHNVRGMEALLRILQVLGLAWGATLPILLWRMRPLIPRADALSAVIPHHTLVLYFLAPLLRGVLGRIVSVPPRYVAAWAESAELMELTLYLGLLLFVILERRRAGIAPGDIVS